MEQELYGDLCDYIMLPIIDEIRVDCDNCEQLVRKINSKCNKMELARKQVPILMKKNGIKKITSFFYT